jgi:hypothetical protein
MLAYDEDRRRQREELAKQALGEAARVLSLEYGHAVVYQDACGWTVTVEGAPRRGVIAEYRMGIAVTRR